MLSYLRQLPIADLANTASQSSFPKYLEMDEHVKIICI